jgi:hypothetical protein
MPYVTSVERSALKRGREEGLREGELKGERMGERKGLLRGIRTSLRLKFGAQAEPRLPLIDNVADVDRLGSILDALEAATSPDDIRRLCP